jgi:hypothetical protein
VSSAPARASSSATREHVASVRCLAAALAGGERERRESGATINGVDVPRAALNTRSRNDDGYVARGNFVETAAARAAIRVDDVGDGQRRAGSATWRQAQSNAAATRRSSLKSGAKFHLKLPGVTGARRLRCYEQLEQSVRGAWVYGAATQRCDGSRGCMNGWCCANSRCGWCAGRHSREASWANVTYDAMRLSHIRNRRISASRRLRIASSSLLWSLMAQRERRDCRSARDQWCGMVQRTRRLQVRQHKLAAKSQCEGQRRRSDVVNSGCHGRGHAEILRMQNQICTFAIVFLTQRRFRRRNDRGVAATSAARNGIYRRDKEWHCCRVNIRRGDVC